MPDANAISAIFAFTCALSYFAVFKLCKHLTANAAGLMRTITLRSSRAVRAALQRDVALLNVPNVAHHLSFGCWLKLR